MKKKIIVFLLSTVLCAAVFAQNAGGFKTDGKGTITGYDGNERNVVIPSQIDGVTITAIGDRAFSWNNLTNVTIGSGVTSIGASAFGGCTSLTEVTFKGTIPIRGFQAGAYPEDLRDKFYETDSTNGTPGTYTRPNMGMDFTPIGAHS